MSIKSESKRNLSKAARLVILYELDRVGYLEGMTLQQIADLFEVGHRSTIMRDLRVLEQVKEVLPEMKNALKRDYFRDEVGDE